MMKANLNRADEKLRALLLGTPGRLVSLALEALVCAAFIALLLTRTLTQLSGASAAARILTAALFALPLLAMLHFARGAGEGQSLLVQALLFAVCAAAMLARLSFIERSSGDYDLYLADWLARLGAGSFSEGMRANIGEYNVLYQYILFLVTRLPVPPLYAVKAATFIGDAFLAGAAAHLAGEAGHARPAALCAVLLLPTCVLGGGMFAQCDSLYAACALWGLALALEDKPAASAVCFALSLAFKLQAVFLLPIVAVLWAGRRLRLADALIFLLTLLAVALPALAGGKSPMQILSIYTAQTGLYTGLNYNAANFFGLMNTAGLDVYAYGNFGMALAAGYLALLLALAMPRAQRLSHTDAVRLALMMVLGVVFFLPRMHERYFYLADMLAVTLACREKEGILPAALIALASLSTYWETALPLPLASAMMLTALILILWQAKKACEADGNIV